MAKSNAEVLESCEEARKVASNLGVKSARSTGDDGKRAKNGQAE